jgi:hypothetical protein
MVINSHPLYRLSYWGMENDFFIMHRLFCQAENAAAMQTARTSRGQTRPMASKKPANFIFAGFCQQQSKIRHGGKN